MNQLLKKMIAAKRREFDKVCDARIIPSQAKEGVTEFLDIPYLKDGNRAHLLDVFFPMEYEGTLPVIVNIHGGGLVMGNKEFNRHFCYCLSKLGFLVFSIEYRLCPEVTVFEQLQDIAAAMNKIDHMIPKFYGMPGIVHIVADSAGAFLALYTAAIQRNPSLAKEAGVRPSYLEIQSMALISGMFYTLRKDSIGLFLPPALYGDDYRNHPFYPYLNPNNSAVNRYLPPCLLITSRQDNLHQYSLDMASALRRGRTPCILKDYGDAGDLTHAFSVFHPESSTSKKVMEDIKRFFLTYDYE